MIIPTPDTPFNPIFSKLHEGQPFFDLLRHDSDDAPTSSKVLKSRFFTATEISTFVADRARSFCTTNSYDPSLYTENPYGCVAVIDDVAGLNNHAQIFPVSSQLTVDEKYKEAFDSYGKSTCFQRAMKGQVDIAFRKQTATDIAEREDFTEFHEQMAAGAITLFKCPVPDCKMEFGPILELSCFYKHLEDAVHWEYFLKAGWVGSLYSYLYISLRTQVLLSPARAMRPSLIPPTRALDLYIILSFSIMLCDSSSLVV
jgi:hypothetical protein